MAADRKRGLGRGLDALLDPYQQEAGAQGVAEVNIRDIDNNPLQPRKDFNEEKLNELAASIKVHGIVQPLIVKANNGRYSIIAGERRFRAARLAGLHKVPVIVADYDDEQIHEVSLIENIQREDLNPVEEAASIRFLMEQHDMTQEEISERLGKSRPAVANALRLLSLPEKVRDMVKTGVLSAGHGRALAGVPDAAAQLKLANEAVQLGYSVRALESRIKNMDAERPVKKKTEPVLSAELSDAETRMREKLGTRVQIRGSEKRGKITLEYYSRTDLQHIYDCIVGSED